MNMLRVLKIIVPVITVLFLFCSGNNVAGTAGSETVNTFALVVLDENNNPVSGASVRIVAGETWLSKVADNTAPLLLSGTSGSNGVTELPLDSINETDINICANSGTNAVFLPSYSLQTLTDSIPDTIVVRPSTVLSGVITAEAALPQRIVLQGTDYSADVDQVTGSYSLAGVPSGEYNVIAITNDAQKVSGVGTVAVNGEAAISTTFKADFTGILVDDFETGSNLMTYFGSGDWYIAKDGDVSVSFPAERDPSDTTHIPYESARVTDGAFEGTSLRINYQVQNDSYFYLIVGAKVSSYAVGFTNIDTITFQAKGSGRLAIRLHGEENSDKPQVYAYVNLDTVWTKYTITSDMYEISDPSNASATWNDVEGRMQWLSFLPGADGNDFRLDDVRLEGVTLPDLIVP